MASAGAIGLHRTGLTSYREALPDGAENGDPVVLVHGFPESSLMWEPLMERLARAGRRCVAPDLYCLGDSQDPGPATFERNLEALAELHRALELDRVALVVHDWGGFVGLAWACHHPDQVSALVISDTGFFADGKWHGMAEVLRSEQGEELMEAIDRDGFAALLSADGADFSQAEIDAYWRPFAEGRGREATLEFYRSMDFEKLAPYEGRLATLGVPALLLWGADDRFAPLAGARRLESEIPGAKLVAIDGAGHFVYDQATQRCVDEAVGFLTEVPEVLFVCVHNAGRSQMAAGLLARLAKGRLRVRTAGSDPADQINPTAVEAMREVGVDLSREFPKPLTDEFVRAADAVITMGCGDACPIYPGKRYEDWELEDPAGKDLDTVRRIRDEIELRVRALLDELAPSPAN